MKIVYALTDVCNGNCLHCYKRLNRSSLIARPIEQCKKDIEVLLGMGHQIILGGAENLTDPGYLEMYGLVGQKYILSNGTLLAQSRRLGRELISAGIKEVHISWHIGLQNIINSIPEEIVKKAVDNVIKAGLAAKILCVIGSPNFNLLVQIAERVKNIGATSIKFLQLISVTNGLSVYQMTEEQKTVAIGQIKAIRSQYKKENLYVEVHGTFNAITLTEKRSILSTQGNFCPAGRTFVNIDTDNKVYPCPFLAQPQFQIGIWRNGRLKMDKVIPNSGRVCLAESQLTAH